MNIATEGIVLKQLHIAGGKRMILLFTKEYGKISCGTSIPVSGGKNKNSLALRPFVLGKYQLKRQNDLYYMNGAETVKSHYSLGENIDKFMTGSFLLELTEQVAQENEPAPELYNLIDNFLDFLEKREENFELVSLTYQTKLLGLLGVAPDFWHCASCGKELENATALSVSEGAIYCPECANEKNQKEYLLYDGKFSIILMLRYLMTAPLSKLEKQKLEAEAAEPLARFLRDYYAAHLDVHNLKSSVIAREIL